MPSEKGHGMCELTFVSSCNNIITLKIITENNKHFGNKENNYNLSRRKMTFPIITSKTTIQQEGNKDEQETSSEPMGSFRVRG